jgi:peptidoglycan/xylan/chitin deacetylase (PgdA/CDA1 family)
MKLNPQFFRQTDIDDVPGPPRELVGYGEHPPRVRWHNGAKVAVQIVVNYEEGSEKTFAMGDRVNDGMYELPFAVDDQRDLAVESMYEYGSRAGIWRMFRIFDAAAIPVTFFAAAVALERNPAVAVKLVGRGDEVAGHGYRWSNHYEMNRDEEREAIRRAIASIEKTTGARPLGWYCREMSVNTRALVVEEGGPAVAAIGHLPGSHQLLGRGERRGQAVQHLPRRYDHAADPAQRRHPGAREARGAGGGTQGPDSRLARTAAQSPSLAIAERCRPLAGVQAGGKHRRLSERR